MLTTLNGKVAVIVTPYLLAGRGLFKRSTDRLFSIAAWAWPSNRRSKKAPVADVALQAVVQGILTAIVALLLYGRMVSILGATAGAAFVALTPATTALLAIQRARRSAFCDRLDRDHRDLGRRVPP